MICLFQITVLNILQIDSAGKEKLVKAGPPEMNGTDSSSTIWKTL